MTDFSGFTEEQIARAIFKDEVADIQEETVYVSLHNADEGNNPDGTEEIDNSDYDRVAVSTADWDVTGDGPTVVSNNAEISFGNPESDWGTATHFAIWTEDQGVTGEEPITSTVALDEEKTIDGTIDKVSYEEDSLTAEID